ncbi:MAG: carboxypeptidase regulatory-like domain-containing protein [Kofleriaceae bacterium]
MRNHAWLATLLFAGVLAGCHHRAGSHVTGGVLGRVVIYRNGVAFYERNATIEDGRVTVRVPRERVDDFLKSLTVVDKATGKPMGVTIPRRDDSDGTYLSMTLETPDAKRGQVLLTYVTEAPAWKPSYRIVVGKNNKVMLEGWAIVDNTTSEDWKGVLVGVGASSALAFRYDLWSVHTVERDLLRGEEKFAIAPPSGVSPYSDNNSAEELVAIPGSTIAGSVAQTGSQGDDLGVSFSGSTTLENTTVIDPRHEGSSSGISTTSGSVRGVVSDQQSGERLPGVTVVATSPSLQGTQTAITDENGTYSIGDLPPGSYTISMYYADVQVQRAGVTVGVNKVTPVFQKLNQRMAAGEVIAIKDTAPVIDQGSTRTGVTLDKNYTRNIPTGRTFGAATGAAAGSQKIRQGKGANGKFSGYEEAGGSRNGESSKLPEPPLVSPQRDTRLDAIVAKVQKDKRDVVIEVHGAPGTEQQAIARGTTIKNRLVDDGIAAPKIHIVPKVGVGETDNVRVLAVAPRNAPDTAAAPPVSRISPGDTPVGESHFIAERPMTVRSGSSAMVAIHHDETTGGVVYLYDPISERGDKRFAFKAVRLDNPTGDTLEAGPVTVYGDGRFIGEGITEPVPPHAAAVIPFALDKQVIVTTNGSEADSIAKLITVQRGVITAQVQHRRDAKFVVTSRLTVPTTVYLRHRLETGWSLLDHPKSFTKVGDSHLFRVDLGPGETRPITISEATPVERTFDLSSEEALGMMKVFIDDPKASPDLKLQIDALLATHRGAADLVDKIATLREQITEYRSRSGELHAQIASLKAVRTGGELLATLKTKLSEMSDRTQKATIALVETQEKLMLSRVKFQNQLAELKLTDVTKETAAKR